MSIELTLDGRIDILLSHMVMLGAGAILEERWGNGTVEIEWTQTNDPEPLLILQVGDAITAAEVIRRHAEERAEDNSWLRAHHAAVGALLAARTKSPKSDDKWQEVLTASQRAAAPLRGLDSEMLVGLGERAWWHRDSARPGLRPDSGSSPWEMKTRNQGQDVVKDRLLPLARTVAARTPEQILDGLTGRSVVDELDGKPSSRTATGFAQPGPADSARGWCALWGLSALPMWPMLSGASRPSARLPRLRPAERDRLAAGTSTSDFSGPAPEIDPAGEALLMPLPAHRVTLSRWRRILRSQDLLRQAGHAMGRPAPVVPAKAATEMLNDLGFAHTEVFGVSTSNANAPERRAKRGSRIP